jgi:hypothetical protein
MLLANRIHKKSYKKLMDVRHTRGDGRAVRINYVHFAPMIHEGRQSGQVNQAVNDECVC